jgi:hypothetical protein
MEHKALTHQQHSSAIEMAKSFVIQAAKRY